MALCEMGWAYHQGLNPESIKDLSIAIEYYLKSASQGHAPASSLLADVYYFDHDGVKDWTKATKYLKDVILQTSPGLVGDAYVRTKALQKLGIMVHRGGVCEHTNASHQTSGAAYFNDALSLCNTHFKNSWAFLLAHDPPGLWENLEREDKLLGDAEVLGRLMSGLVCTSQGGADGSALSQLQYYTRSLRRMENNPAWVARWQTSVLDVFPDSNDSGSWGVTYFQSFLRIMMEPIVQHTVSVGRGGVPKVVVLGSALGNIVAWAALAFGFRGVGLDALAPCTEGATELYTTAVDAIERKNEVLQQYKASAMVEDRVVPAADASKTVGKVVFERVNVVSDTEHVSRECDDANVVWINDFSWSVAAQRAVEATALASMPSGSLMVLYRPPHFPPQDSQLIKVVSVATSWNPALDMHLVYKK